MICIKLQKLTKEQYFWVSLRFAMAWLFIWAFLDKMFGLGFSTAHESAWINGGSPTSGFLTYGTTGPLTELYQGLANNVAVDVLFMVALLLIGIALLLGIGTKIAGYSGALLMFLMWTAVLLPEHNPILDEHIIYSIVLVGIAIVNPGRWWSLREWWINTRIVKRYPFLE